MHRFFTTALLLLLAAPASSGAASPEQAMDDFVGIHGPHTLVALEHGGRGVTFAGRFASDPLPGTTDLAALAFLERWAQMWGFDPDVDLSVADVHLLFTLTYVRFGQVHDGIRVEGADVVVTLDAGGRIRQVASAFSWPQGWASGSPSMGLDGALALVREKLPHLVPTGQFRLVYLPSEGVAPLSWVLRTHSHTGPEAPEVYVDAHTGEVLMEVDTNVYADGNVYETNPRADPTVVRRELANLTSTTELDGTYAHAWACTPREGGNVCPGRTRNAVPDGDGHYLFSPDEPSLADPFSEVMGYYHLDGINQHMEDAYGHAHTCDDHRWMDIQVNMDYENAWLGDQDDNGCSDITMGQSAYDFSYDSSIIYHEFGHAINHTYCEFRRTFDNLGPDWSGPGLNEGFADYWAATFTGNPIIGEYASLGTGEWGFRNLSIRAVCPDELYGESHYDGPVWSTTLWDIRSVIGMDKADRLALAILPSLTSRPDWDEAGRAAMSQASALESTGVLSASDVTAVDAAVVDHQLVGCERIVTLEDGDVHMFLAPLWRWDYDSASGLQFKLYAPPTATRVTALFDPWTSDGGYTIYVKRNTPVWVQHEGPDIWVEDYDFRFTGSPERVTFTEWSDPPLEPDTTYYFTYMHNDGTFAMTVEAIITAPVVEDTTTDAVEDPTEDPAGDSIEDVPADPEEDPADGSTDAPADRFPDPGSIVEARGGCGCTLVV